MNSSLSLKVHWEDCILKMSLSTLRHHCLIVFALNPSHLPLHKAPNYKGPRIICLPEREKGKDGVLGIPKD